MLLVAALAGLGALARCAPADSSRVAFRLQEVGDSGQVLMCIDGQLNGQAAAFVFDTGSSHNVISPALARRYGLQRLDGEMRVRGMRTVSGHLALARRLRLGRVVVDSVRFLVLDMAGGDASAHALADSLQLVVGQPLLRRYACYAVDFDRHEVVLGRTAVRRQGAARLSFTPGGVPQALVSKDGHAFRLTLDTGATTSSLGPDYYKAFAAEVARLGRWDVQGGSGYGGTVYSSVFVLPAVTLSLGSHAVALPRVPVVAMSSERTAIHSGYGRLGLDFFRRCRRVEIDHVNMTVSIPYPPPTPSHHAQTQDH